MTTIIKRNHNLTNDFELWEFLESVFYVPEIQRGVYKQFKKDQAVLMPNLIKLANNLQVLRDELQEGIHISIAYRPEWWEWFMNRGGDSQHTLCLAADIKVDSLSPQQVFNAILNLIEAGKMYKGGLKYYDTFTHYDCGSRIWIPQAT
jgi:uncharacterized protein YcbK (DUF882 family)